MAQAFPDGPSYHVVRVIPASYFSIVCIGFWKNSIQTGKLISLIIKEDEIYNVYRERVRCRMIPAYFCQPYLWRMGRPL